MGSALHFVVVFLFARGVAWALRGMGSVEPVAAFSNQSQKKCISCTIKSKFNSLPTASVAGLFVFSFSILLRYLM